ncbi:MAG TPA: class I SAM-dependent methyltransferase [Planctomycetota bacterium]|nr:class I SAM-dependent methyltransferase [Planctomycetota bacterium]
MTSASPIDLLFAGMEKLGPGDNASTIHVLRQLPRRRWARIVDAGCGTGRQTLALAEAIGSSIDAIDSHQPFLDELVRRAKRERLDALVQPRCMDMKDIPSSFRQIDLLWSEGAAYNIGFANALATWRRAMQPDGFVVLSELCWLRSEAPGRVREFFTQGYPDMMRFEENISVARSVGYELVATHTLSDAALVDGYYDELGPRAAELLKHPDAQVRELAAETLREIEIFEASEGSYGYVFFALRNRK